MALAYALTKVFDPYKWYKKFVYIYFFENMKTLIFCTDDKMNKCL